MWLGPELKPYSVALPASHSTSVDLQPSSGGWARETKESNCWAQPEFWEFWRRVWQSVLRSPQPSPMRTSEKDAIPCKQSRQHGSLSQRGCESQLKVLAKLPKNGLHELMPATKGWPCSVDHVYEPGSVYHGPASHTGSAVRRDEECTGWSQPLEWMWHDSQCSRLNLTPCLPELSSESIGTLWYLRNNSRNMRWVFIDKRRALFQVRNRFLKGLT